jgi:hypothetical protein
MLSGLEAFPEGAGVQVQIRRDLPVDSGGERTLVLEDSIVVLPELPLIVRAQRGLGRGTGFGMIRQRVVAIDEPDFVSVGLFNLL